MWKLMMVIAGAAVIHFLVRPYIEGLIMGFIEVIRVESAIQNVIEANHLNLAMDDMMKIGDVIFDKLRVAQAIVYDVWAAEIERGNGGFLNIRASIGRAKSMYKITTAFIDANDIETTMKELGYLNSTEGS